MGRVWGVFAGVALSLAAGFGAEAQPQDKPAAPAAAPQQDRVAVVGVLDSWYKVLLGEQLEHIGHVHERLTKETAGQPWRYLYESQAEIDLMVTDPSGEKKQVPFTESSKVVDARLDDTFSPQEMKQTDVRNGVEVHSTVIPEESGRKMEVKSGSAQEGKRFPVGDEEIYFSRFLMFVALRQSGNLSKPGTRKLMLFSPRPDDKPPVAEIQIEIRDVERREYLGKKDLPVTKVVYLKPPPAAIRELELSEAYVDKFGRIVEEVTRGGIRRLLVKDEAEAVGKDTRIRQGARRDPFRKELAMAPAKGVEESKGAATVVDPDNMSVSIKKAQEKLEELRRAKDEGRDVEGQKIYDAIVEMHIAMKRSMLEKAQPPNVQAEVERVRDEAEKIWEGLARLMRKLRGVYVKVLQHFDKDECEEMQKGIEELKKAALERKELVDRPELGQVNLWIGELEPLVVKCRTRQELARKSIVLTGTLIHDSYQFIPVDARVMVFGHPAGVIHPVRFMKPDRLAVVNEKMYRVGDTVEGQGVRVEKIWAHGIQVSLREETRDIPIRQR
jgi:hypothetical protein